MEDRGAVDSVFVLSGRAVPIQYAATEAMKIARNLLTH